MWKYNALDFENIFYFILFALNSPIRVSVWAWIRTRFRAVLIPEVFIPLVVRHNQSFVHLEHFTAMLQKVRPSPAFCDFFFSKTRQDKDLNPCKVLLATACVDSVRCGQCHTCSVAACQCRTMTLYENLIYDTVIRHSDRRVWQQQQKKRIFSSLHLTSMFISCVRKPGQQPLFLPFQLSGTFYAFLYFIAY